MLGPRKRIGLLEARTEKEVRPPLWRHSRVCVRRLFEASIRQQGIALLEDAHGLVGGIRRSLRGPGKKPYGFGPPSHLQQCPAATDHHVDV